MNTQSKKNNSYCMLLLPIVMVCLLAEVHAANYTAPSGTGNAVIALNNVVLNTNFVEPNLSAALTATDGSALRSGQVYQVNSKSTILSSAQPDAQYYAMDGKLYIPDLTQEAASYNVTLVLTNLEPLQFTVQNFTTTLNAGIINALISGATANLGISTVGAMGPQGPAGNDGATGPQGAKGDTGAAGINGLPGAKGEQGSTGLAGKDGKTVLHGLENPQSGQGSEGDFFINTQANTLWGPKSTEGWPVTFVALVGPKGEIGAPGKDGLPGVQGRQGEQGIPGANGATGSTGPAGKDGLTTSVNRVTQIEGNITLTKADLGLSNVDNTNDLSKPISTAMQAALNLKATLVSPTFTGTPSAPTPSVTDNSMTIATTSFVKNVVGSFQYKIGNVGPGGGFIFFVDYHDEYPGLTYLEAAPFDLQPSIWCDKADLILEASGWSANAIGHGQANTIAMLNSCSSGAAFTVKAFSENSALNGGKNDWYLPSATELLTMSTNLRQTGVGNLSIGSYWSSTQLGNGAAWVNIFYGGLQSSPGNTNVPVLIRAVRSF